MLLKDETLDINSKQFDDLIFNYILHQQIERIPNSYLL